MARPIKVKFPRVIVSPERHISLQKEINERGGGITLEQLAEEKFIKADNKN